METTGANPAVTIAIPTYKRPQYLVQAIDSAVNQNPCGLTYNIIVVNNDPETDMAALKEKYAEVPISIEFFTNERNLGMLGNVNRCMELAKGKYVAYLHDDDLLLPNYISEVEAFLHSHADFGCMIPERYLLFESDENAQKHPLEEKRKRKALLKKLFLTRYLRPRKYTKLLVEDNIFSFQNCYCAPSCGALFTKAKAQKSGLFFPEGTYSWDFISFCKINENENIFIVHTPMSVYRMTSGASLRPDVQYQSYMEHEKFIRDNADNPKCRKFIRKYQDEMTYLNYSRLSYEAREMIAENKQPIPKQPTSKLKHASFMVARLCYWSTHNLDVEIPLSSKGKELLHTMSAIQ